MSMIVKWISLRDAMAFNRKHHRHLPKIQGGIVSLGCWVGKELVGVCILGRGARLDSEGTVVITRLCTNGHKGACSKLYSKAKRLAQAMGFVKIKTFTTQHESGASLRAVNAECDGQVEKGGGWNTRPGRFVDEEPPRNRWTL